MMKEGSVFSKYLNRSYWNVKTATEAVLFLLTAFQFCYIAWLNLFCCKSWIDHDASMLYSHTIHMWEQGRFVIPFYSEETFLHIDTSCLFAVPLYGLTKNIFLSYGISNILFVIITIIVIADIVRHMNVSRAYCYAAILLYLIPYRMGMLQYTTMMFFECSFYNVCVLVPLLAIDLFFYAGEEVKSIRYKVLFAVYVFFTALTAFSRGTYTLLIALLPVVLCYALEVILSEDGLKHITRSKVILVCATFISYFAGLGLGKITGFMPKVTGYTLVLPHDIIYNFINVIWGHFSIFIGHDTPDVLSAAGIKTLILFAFSVFTLIIIIFNLKFAFRKDAFSNHLRYLTVIYIWNFCVLGLTDCTGSDYAFPERYLFPGFVAILISLPIMLTCMEKIERKLLRQVLYLAIGVLTLCTIGVADINIPESFAVNAEELQGIREVITYAREQGLDTVFFLNDDNAGLIARSLDPTLKVVSIEAHEDGTYELRARENYMCAHDRAFYSDANLLAVTWNAQPEDVLSEYMRSSYQFAGDVEDYHLYLSGENKFDDRAGFPLNDRIMNESIDFAHTAGYQCAGEIDLYGYLETDGNDNYVLISPLLDAPYCACDVTLTYEMGHKTSGETYIPSDPHQVGQLQILDAALQPVQTADMASDQTQASLTLTDPIPCYIAVLLHQNEQLTIQNIRFTVH
ncbi:MAG: hypothetical protein K5649_09180 [Lachnospiraceae bacterium]|nr:hypothetical protein [Lachnospiraceae bacterium]